MLFKPIFNEIHKKKLNNKRGRRGHPIHLLRGVAKSARRPPLHRFGVRWTKFLGLKFRGFMGVAKILDL